MQAKEILPKRNAKKKNEVGKIVFPPEKMVDGEV